MTISKKKKKRLVSGNQSLVWVFAIQYPFISDSILKSHISSTLNLQAPFSWARNSSQIACCWQKASLPGTARAGSETPCKAGLWSWFTSCLDMPGMTGGDTLHLGSKSEKNIPGPEQLHGIHPRVPNMKLLSGGSAHSIRPASCLQRAPTAGCPPRARRS